MAAKKKLTKDRSSHVWAALRILIGLIFIWAFMDKMFGLGFSTCRTVDPQTRVETVQVLCEKSVAKGASPTEGFLKFGTKGPMQDFYKGLAGNPVADFLFMAGLGLIGTALVLGVGVKIAAVSGALLLFMMYTAAMPPANNPLIDDHIIYPVVLLGILLDNKNQKWGLGKWWQKQNLVKKYPILA